MRSKWGVLIGVIIIAIAVLLGTGFYYTGVGGISKAIPQLSIPRYSGQKIYMARLYQ